MTLDDVMKRLAEQGFVPENTPASDASQDSGEDTPLAADNGANAVPDIVESTPDRMSIEVPLEGFSPVALSNLEKLVVSKAALLRKAIGTECLNIDRLEDRLSFPWFPLSASREEINAYYSLLVSKHCGLAKKQQRVITKEKTCGKREVRVSLLPAAAWLHRRRVRLRAQNLAEKPNR